MGKELIIKSFADVERKTIGIYEIEGKKYILVRDIYEFLHISAGNFYTLMKTNKIKHITLFVSSVYGLNVELYLELRERKQYGGKISLIEIEETKKIFNKKYHYRYDEFCSFLDVKAAKEIKTNEQLILDDEPKKIFTIEDLKELVIENGLEEELYIYLDDKFKEEIDKELQEIIENDKKLYANGFIPVKYEFSDKFKIGSNIIVIDKESKVEQKLCVLNNYGNKLEAFTIDDKTENIKGKERIQIRIIEADSCIDGDVSDIIIKLVE